jgi:hypothetical protein
MHHLHFDGAANPVTTTPVAGNYTVTPCSISASGPITIGPPLKGKNWIVLNGAVNDSYVDYGSEILAVADGTVTGILDGQDANASGGAAGRGSGARAEVDRRQRGWQPHRARYRQRRLVTVSK